MGPTLRTLSVVDSCLDAVVEACLAALPYEACGLLGGQMDTAWTHYPLANVAEDPGRRFVADPQGMLRAFTRMDHLGEELIAIYHSHPHTPAVPSRADIGEAMYPSAFYVIVGLARPQKPDIRAYRLNVERRTAAQARWRRIPPQRP